MRKAHPLDQPAAPLPLTDVYNSTTLIPYLENLYEEFYDDEDGGFGMYEVFHDDEDGRFGRSYRVTVWCTHMSDLLLPSAFLLK